MSQVSQFCFPILDIKDIVLYLREVNSDIDVSENDFQHPQRDRWQKFYTVILCECFLDLTPDSLCQASSITTELSYPELYEDSMPLFNLVKAMQALLTTCGIEDFTMQDVLTPRTKRLVRICSAVINFKRFQEERMNVYEEMMRENEVLLDQRESLVKENEELKMRINTLKSVRAEKEPEIKMLQDSIAEQEQVMENLQKKVAGRQRDTSDLKTKLAEKKAILARLKEELMLAKQEDTKLSAQIVPSPDRLKGEMQRMELQLAQSVAAKDEANVRLRDLRARRDRQTKRDTECDQAIRLMEAIKEQKNEERKVLSDISNDKEEAGTRRDRMKSLDAKNQQLKLQLSMVQEKMEKSTMIHNSKMKEMRATVQHLTDEREKGVEHCSAQQKAVARISHETELMRSDIQHETRKHEEVMGMLQDKYQEILTQLDSYHSKLGGVCEKLWESSN